MTCKSEIRKTFIIILASIIITSGCATSNPEETEELTEPEEQAIIAQGTFDYLCNNEECPTNTIELEFYPEGGKVKGLGIIEYADGSEWEYEFKGYTKLDGTASGTVDMESTGVAFTFNWNSTFGDSVFDGVVVAMDDSGEEFPIPFLLTY